jgi:hypothetical protein
LGQITSGNAGYSNSNKTEASFNTENRVTGIKAQNSSFLSINIKLRDLLPRELASEETRFRGNSLPRELPSEGTRFRGNSLPRELASEETWCPRDIPLVPTRACTCVNTQYNSPMHSYVRTFPRLHLLRLWTATIFLYLFISKLRIIIYILEDR